ncbi:heterokaryon incompatibility protein-domain-containing protein, partial [Lineolata rhizophorae]
YEYRQLANDDDIRLIVLFPKLDGSQEVRCMLLHFPLASVPLYEAISYAWGDPSKTQTIIVDGRPYATTTKVLEILRGMASPESSRLLWIDAVCINQDDLDEKATQIPLMSKIYCRATSTAVWLG